MGKRGRASDRRDLGVAWSAWEQRRLGEAASLLRDRNSFKGPGNPHARNEHAAFGFFGACIFKYCQNVVILVSSVPPIESLKSKTTLKKFD